MPAQETPVGSGPRPAWWRRARTIAASRFPAGRCRGVITAGGAQNLLKGQRMLPGRRIAVAGNGPLLLVVAAYLARAGAKVVAVAEAAPVARRLPWVLGGLLAMPGLITLAARHRARLLASGTPVLSGYTVVEARGQGQVEEAVLAPIDGQGRVERGAARHLAVDALVVGFGLQCSSELARLAGCDTGYRPLDGGWTPLRDSWMESSVPGLYLAGDGAAVGGAEMALAEGELAGLAAARRARGGLSGPGMRRVEAVTRRLGRLGRFRAALQHLFAPPRSFAGLLTDGTVLCRCEDVDVGLLNRLCRQPGLDLPAIKSRSRAGMGRCQGRNCLAALAHLLAEHRGVSAAALRWPGLRPPARPVPIAAVVAEPMAPPVLPEDPHLPRTRE